METDQESNKKTPTQCKYTRHMLSVLGFFGVFNMYAMRVNMSLAMVAMVKESVLTNKTKGSCSRLSQPSYLDGKTSTLPKSQGEFDWNAERQGYILSAFFIGYVITTLPAGFVATKYGAKWMFGVGILLSGILSLLTPVMAKWDAWAVCGVRALEGLSQGVALPAINSLIGRWVPKNERSRHFTVIYNGAPAGTVVALAVTGVLCNSKVGWQSVFYLSGASACLWFILWAFLTFEGPYDHPYITEMELLKIREGINRRPVKPKIPCKSIAKSVPFYALVFAHFGDDWGFFTLCFGMPSYLGNVMSYDILKNGFLATLPYVLYLLSATVASIVADVMRVRDTMKITNIRKIMASIALFIPGICLFIVPFLGCRPIPILVLLTLALGVNGLKLSGNNIVHIDMSPDFAGLLYAISNTLSSLSGVLTPIVIAQSTKSGQTRGNWNVVFFVASALYLAAGIVFDVFGTAEEQPWGIDTKLVEEADSSSQQGDEDDDPSERK